MALPDSAKLVTGTPIVLADLTDAGSGSAILGARTDQIDLTGVLADNAQQSDKVDFGASLDLEYVLASVMEFATAPTAGATVDFYISWSNESAAGSGNAGNASGADGPYTGYSANLSDSLKQLQYVGSHVATVQAAGTPQVDTAVATISPRARYGTIIVHNNTAVSLAADANEMAVRLTPLVTQIQD